MEGEATSSHCAHDEAEYQSGKHHYEKSQRESASRIASLESDHLGRQR